MKLSRQNRSRVAWLLSFLKRRWTFADYPVDYVDQGEISAFPPDRFTHHRWRADALGTHLTGLADTREAAGEKLRQNFEDYVAGGGSLRRPGSKLKISFALNAEVTRFPALQKHFIKHVLSLDWALLTDESSLWDFHGELDNSALYQTIGEVYGVDVSHVPHANISAILIEIMEQIHEFPENPIVRAVREGRDARDWHNGGDKPLPWRPYP